MHPFVLGEVACGNLRSRSKTLDMLARLPFAVPASDEEVLGLLEQNRLFGQGLGWVDAHLLASARLTNCRLWTLDRPLRDAASALKIGYSAVM
jgi:predicted nucleic acid-binding protein